MGSWGNIGLLLAGALAGLINTLAGGGPVLTLMALTLFGLDPRLANLTSTMALMPGQLLTSNGVWRRDAGAVRLTALLAAVAVIGGAAGAWLLIATPPQQFGRIVPWLVLFATAAYAFAPQPPKDASAGQAAVRLPRAFVLALIPLSIYGGFFGGGNSFLLLAALGFAAVTGKLANTTKNAFVGLINGAAATVFIFAGSVAWAAAVPLAIGNIAGSLVALKFLDRVSAGSLRWIVIASGLGLAAMLLLRS